MGRCGDWRVSGPQWVYPVEGQTVTLQHWSWNHTYDINISSKSSLTLHVLIFTTLQDFTWCLVITAVSLLARSWSSIGSRYTTGSDILLFCRHTKHRYDSISGVSYMGWSVSVFLSVYGTWISALSIAPNISTFLSVLDGFCRSNLRL